MDLIFRLATSFQMMGLIGMWAICEDKDAIFHLSIIPSSTLSNWSICFLFYWHQGMMKGSVVTLVSLLLMHAIAIVVANGTPRNRPYSVLDSPEANRPLYAGFDNMRLSMNGSVLLWPMPAHVTRGKSILALASGFAFGQADGQHISATLAQAFSRYIDIIYEQHSLFQVVSSGLDIPVLEKLLVSLDSSTEEVNTLILFFMQLNSWILKLQKDLVIN